MVVVNVRLMLPSLVLNPLSAPERLKLIRDHAERLKQNRCLSDEIRRIRDIHTTLPLVLAGDFNVRGDVASLDPLRAILRDAWHETGRGWGGTMTSSFPVARIDQCWVSDGVRPVSARVAPTSHSDHRILLVDLQPDSSRAAKSSP
jgi:endonuclease/exonuclease/phosphatase (EEP) superfamily protein YafD